MATLSDWVDFSNSKNRQISEPSRMTSPRLTGHLVPGLGIGMLNNTAVMVV